MSSFFDQARSHLIQTIQSLLTQPGAIVLAVSGGVDSMVLLHVVRTLQQEYSWPAPRFVVVSLDHGCREESQQEVLGVSEAAGDFEFYTESYTGKESSERALRNRRHAALIACARRFGARCIMTGHHLNDRIESMLLHARRGAGLAGLVTMRRMQSHRIDENIFLYRPFLSCTKEILRSYAQQHSLTWFEDPSNSDTSVSQRNTLRNDILPWLLEGNFHQSMRTLFSVLEQQREQLGQEVVVQDAICTPRVAHTALSSLGYAPSHKQESGSMLSTWSVATCTVGSRTVDHVARLLRSTHHYQGMTHALLQDVYELIHTGTSGYKERGDSLLVLADGQLHIMRIHTDESPGDVEKGTYVSIPTQAEMISFDGLALRIPRRCQSKGYRVRYGSYADRAQGKRWSKFCINIKIPRFLRKAIPVIVDSHDDIVYVWRDRQAVYVGGV